MTLSFRLVFLVKEQVLSANPVQNAPPAETVEQQVQRLLATWREETAVISSSTVLVSHPAYREIIALGAADRRCSSRF
jgi:hypothetical protein